MRRSESFRLDRHHANLAVVCVAVMSIGLAPVAAAQNTMDVLHAFGTNAPPASPSYGRLLEMPGGTFYGTTTAGDGAIYKLTPDGLGGHALSVLHSFRGVDGRTPQGWLIDGGDEYLYGTTQEGGGADAGTVYRIDSAGRLTVLHSFNHTDGANPIAGLLDGGDGFLYGTTTQGTIFRLDKNGSSFLTLHWLGTPDGAYPYGGLVRGSDGFLYGTTYTGYGVGNSYGTIYRIRSDGTGFARMHSFDYPFGAQPFAGLVNASDGKLYGTTTSGGSGYAGTVYRFDPTNGTFSHLHSLSWSEGASPSGELVEGTDGWLYGTAARGGAYSGGALFKIHPTTLAFTTLQPFASAGGINPQSALIQAADGFLYGTTSSNGPLGGGTVFRVREDGSDFSVVAALDAAALEGEMPESGLINIGDGFLYGTTAGGGAGPGGTVFRMKPDGSSYSVLHSFHSATDGSSPNALLYLPSVGFLYGTAAWGGSEGYGTIFRLGTTGSSFETLHSFRSAADGAYPKGGLVDGGDGYLYGAATEYGPLGGGSLFRLSPSTKSFEVVHPFQWNSGPHGPLLRIGSSLYGTTKIDGPNYTGTVFRFTLGGGFTTLHAFLGPDGAQPEGGLVEGNDGLLYGTTCAGNGTLFRIDPGTGALESLFSFSEVDGRCPGGPLIVGDSGFLYGTAPTGGNLDAGTVFAFSPDTKVLSVLYRFDASDGRGQRPSGPLLQSSDGRLYGTASGTFGTGGSFGGTIFRLSPPAHVLPGASVSICRDQKGPTLVATTAGPAKVYQWGYRDSPGRIWDFVGQTAPSYTVNGADFPDAYGSYFAEVVCTIRFAGDYGESVSNAVFVAVNPPCGGESAVPSPVQVFTASTGNGTASTTLHWVNPSTAVDELVIRYRTDGVYPVSADDAGSQLLCGLPGSSCGSAAVSAIGTFLHSSQTPGTTYSYAAFTRQGLSNSGGKFASATPFNGPPKSAWAYSTGATSVVPPGLRPAGGGTPGAAYTVSNDRGLHAMTLGRAGGDWPAGWKPLLMNAPSQGRPIPVNFPTFTVNGVSKVVYVTSQDGRVYVADALTGALVRASSQICQGIQHSPGAMLRDYGGAYDVLIVGSRNTTTGNPATNALFGLNPDTLAVRWTFDNGVGTNGIGIISGQPLVDYATNRVYFTSRQLAGGSGSTVWCLSFTETSVTKVWEANVGSVDASVTLSNGTLYVGNLDGNVYALNASSGTFKWTAPFVTGDGPIRSLVWSAGTGNRLWFSTTTKSWAITDNGPGTAPTAFWAPPPAIASPSNPLVYAGKAYVGTGTGQLLQFDATTPTPPAPTGVALTPHPEQIGRPTMDSANGVIYVGTDEGTVYAASYPF